MRDETVAAKAEIVAAVQARADRLVRTSQDIFAHPELGFAEHYAHDLLTAALADEGLPVERHAGGLDTAFVCEVGSRGPVIAVCCEYDALPEIGHACGHNIIAGAGLGAGLAAAELAERLGGRVRIIGTPAEEGGGGKVKLLDAGVFDGVDAAMMVHPAGRELTRMDVIAIHHLTATYRGKAAHAAAAPHVGRNALDAAVLGYMNVAALRQHIRSDERIHGIFTKAGDKPNIVPDSTEAVWYVRSPRLELLQELQQRVVTCLNAGAQAAGCEVDIAWYEPMYTDMVDNNTLIELYAANAATIGRRPLAPEAETRVLGSTDMGNISYAVPSIHPMIKVAPADVAIHTADFCHYASGPEGDAAVLDGAAMLAMTIVDLWTAPDALAAVKAEFAELATR